MAWNNCDITKIFHLFSFIVEPPDFDGVLAVIVESNLGNNTSVVTPKWRISQDLLLNPRLKIHLFPPGFSSVCFDPVQCQRGRKGDYSTSDMVWYDQDDRPLLLCGIGTKKSQLQSKLLLKSLLKNHTPHQKRQSI